MRAGPGHCGLQQGTQEIDLASAAFRASRFSQLPPAIRGTLTISPVLCRWVDAGKFLTGFSAIGSIAIPAILFHAQKITGGALALELAAVVVLAATAIAYDYLSNDDGSYYY